MSGLSCALPSAIRRPELLAGALRNGRMSACASYLESSGVHLTGVVVQQQADEAVQLDSYNIFPQLIGRRGPPFTRSNALPTSAFRNSIISGSVLQIVLRS